MLTGLCEPIQCPQVDIEANGVVAGANCLGGDAVFRPTCGFFCEDGYAIVGASRIECGLSGAGPRTELPVHLVPTVANGGISMPGATCLAGGDAAAATTCDRPSPGFNCHQRRDSSFVRTMERGRNRLFARLRRVCRPRFQTRIMRYRTQSLASQVIAFSFSAIRASPHGLWVYMVPMVPKFSAKIMDSSQRWSVLDRLVIKSGCKGAALKA